MVSLLPLILLTAGQPAAAQPGTAPAQCPQAGATQASQRSQACRGTDGRDDDCDGIAGDYDGDGRADPVRNDGTSGNGVAIDDQGVHRTANPPPRASIAINEPGVQRTANPPPRAGVAIDDEGIHRAANPPPRASIAINEHGVQRTTNAGPRAGIAIDETGVHRTGNPGTRCPGGPQPGARQGQPVRLQHQGRLLDAQD